VLCVVRYRSVVSVVCCQVEACCECCVLSGRGLYVGLITRPEESYRVCCFSFREASVMRRPGPLGAVAPWEKRTLLRMMMA